MSVATQPTSVRRSVGLGTLWFGLFGAALAWSVQELVSFSLISHSCYPTRAPLSAPVFADAWGVALAVGLLMLLLGIAAVLTAWRSWRRSESPGREPLEFLLEVGEGHVRFAAFSGLLVGGMMLNAIILTLIALFVVPACG
jgi:hypothetical protein